MVPNCTAAPTVPNTSRATHPSHGDESLRIPRNSAKARWIIAVLRHRHFTSLADLNEVIAGLVARLNDKPFKKLQGSRSSLVTELVQLALRPLSPTRDEFATWKRAKVSIDSHLEVDHHYYSVPYQLAGSVVEMRLSATTDEVFMKSQRVASHLRSYSKGRHVSEPAHLPDSHRRYLEWTPGRIVNWASKNGPSTALFVEGLMASRPTLNRGPLGPGRDASCQEVFTRTSRGCLRAST